MLEPKEWPACWLVSNVGTSEGGVKHETGVLVVVEKNGGLTYSCPCGSKIYRTPGHFIHEVREWVTKHTEHLPQEYRDVPA